ncbi:Protein accelerated cell death [Trema orientale]|uniref:Protein accelerated cell death n=1 Tax=Trema orientale TaxID=63057 RepID=A0A2P5EQK5_TREOI|nr:Protein accelerated cell death [Trema orientale]
MSGFEGEPRMVPRNLLNNDIIMYIIANRGYQIPTGNTDHSNETTPSQLPFMHHNNVAAKYFPYAEVYRAAETGDVALFQKSLEDLELSQLIGLASPRGETVLHIATRSGHDELVRVMLGRHDLSGLVVTKNLHGNIPLQVAASAGHLSTTKILVFTAKEQAEGFLKTVLWSQNEENNTALHLALRNRHEEVASFLFEAEDDREVADCLNRENETPLLMSAQAGYEALFQLMMKKKPDDFPGDRSADQAAPESVYMSQIVHAAVGAKSRAFSLRPSVIHLLAHSNASTTNWLKQGAKVSLWGFKPLSERRGEV